ncbi:MAG: hypothetical protein ACKVQR_07640 [Aquabacterium sp.]
MKSDIDSVDNVAETSSARAEWRYGDMAAPDLQDDVSRSGSARTGPCWALFSAVCINAAGRKLTPNAIQIEAAHQP